MNFYAVILTIFMAILINDSVGEEGYIRNPRWHVRPWKSVSRQSNAIEDENLDSSFVPNDFDVTRERRDEERYIKERTDFPVNPFIQKILDLVAESVNDRPWLELLGRLLNEKEMHSLRHYIICQKNGDEIFSPYLL